jgi:hypothetical protein
MGTEKRSMTSLERWLNGQPDLAGIPPGVIDFLKKPMTFEDRRGRPIHVYVQSIEPPDPKGPEFVRFSFRVRRRADPDYQGPRIEDAPNRDRRTRHARRRAAHGNVFGYVFSSLNSLEENRRNLEDFVRRQCGST